MCSNVYNGVTDFEVCGFIKNTKIKYQDIIFSSDKKIIYCRFEGL